MEKIIIVECHSTGINFIKDLIRRNYYPVVLEPKFDGKTFEENNDKEKMYQNDYNSIEEDFDLIYEQDTFEKTLKMVKEINPTLILPGSENGVILATKLSEELGLLTNPIESLPPMTLKNEMQNALKKAGIRYIRGKVIYSKEEALDYYRESGFKEVVVKPTRNSGSFGVTICNNENELIDAVEQTLGLQGLFGEGQIELVIQERIRGDEYIVNTVSHKGIHRVTTIWKYFKKETYEGNYIYDYMESVNELDIAHAQMIEYAYQVADAIGIKYGPIHGEYMLDEKGPVLIEVNCRPCGGYMDEEFLDNISGQHETDSVLDSYLNPERFHAARMERYRLNSYGGIKFFIVPKKLLAKSIPMKHIGKRLKSHHKTSLIDLADGPQLLEKTKDLTTGGGVIYLTHNDYSVINQDLNFLRSVEHHTFSQIISSGEDKKTIKTEYNSNIIKDLLTNDTIKGTTLLITDEFIDNRHIVQTQINNLDNVSNNFEIVLLDLDESLINKDDEEISKLILDIKHKVKIGGLLLIPEKTYQYIVGGRSGMETLIKCLGLRIEVPPCEIKNIIIATRT